MLAETDLDWGRTEVFQVDERVAPAGHTDRNLTHLILALPMDKQPSLRPMGVTSDDLEEAAAEYAAALPEQTRHRAPRPRAGRAHGVAGAG